MRWLVLLLIVACLAGCATTPPAAPPPNETRAEAYVRMLGELRTTASFYDSQVRKNHTKARVMAVLVGVTAAGAGATIGVLAQPDLPAEARPGIASAGISAVAFSGLLAVLPFAHQYRLKELGYARHGAAAWSALRTLEADCAGTFPDGAEADQAACGARAAAAITAARTFPEDSPCRPPP